MEVNVHEAKTQLSRLLRRVADGDEITISRAGVPVARLVAVGPKERTRPMGMDRNRLWVSDDFDAPLPPDVEALFYSEIPDVNFPPKPVKRAAVPRKKTKKRA